MITITDAYNKIICYVDKESGTIYDSFNRILYYINDNYVLEDDRLTIKYVIKDDCVTINNAYHKIIYRFKDGFVYDTSHKIIYKYCIDEGECGESEENINTSNNSKSDGIDSGISISGIGLLVLGFVLLLAVFLIFGPWVILKSEYIDPIINGELAQLDNAILYVLAFVFGAISVVEGLTISTIATFRNYPSTYGERVFSIFFFTELFVCLETFISCSFLGGSSLGLDRLGEVWPFPILPSIILGLINVEGKQFSKKIWIVYFIALGATICAHCIWGMIS